MYAFVSRILFHPAKAGLIAIIYLRRLLPIACSGTRHILPTEGVAKSSVLSVVKDNSSFHSEREILWSPAANKICARPCTRVRILPFHFHVAMKLFSRRILAFRHWRHCSHLYGYPRQALPATWLRAPSLVLGRVRTFLPCQRQK